MILQHIRCTECGDSQKNKWKKHCAVFDSGATYCLRCGHSNKLSMEALVAISMNLISVEEAVDEEMWDEREPTVPTRFTLLDTYDNGDFHSWMMRDVNGEQTGWSNRHKEKKLCRNEGKRGFGYTTDVLVSSPDSPLVVVEGPYDVIKPHYICTFGTINKSSIKALRLQYVWLWPDFDQICTLEKQTRFVEMARAVRDEYLVFVQGFIVSQLDPKHDGERQYTKI